MYVPDDLKGLNAMIAACATEGATDLEAEDTVAVHLGWSSTPR